MKKYTILFLVVSLFAVLYGCCSRSHDIVFVKHSDDDVVVTSRELVIDELGRLPTVTFPSGAKIEGLEENTLTPGIVVTIVEKKMTAKNADSLINSSDSDIYLYKISAVLNPENPLEAKTYVTSFEKPFKITLPKPQNPQGIVLAAIKESDTDPWRFFNYSDSNEILANIANVRTVQDNTSENTFNLFRLGTEFALISYEGSSGNKLPETFVSSLTASSTNSILVKEGKYLEDLTVKGILKGVKLDSIKPADLRARITYRNNKPEEVPIKVNGVKVTQISMADKTVPGYTYSHSFLVYSPLESNIIGTDGDFSFKLNLKGLETQSFSSGFVIEFFNKIDSEKILPYNYTEFFTIVQNEFVDVAIRIDSGKEDDQEGLFDLNPIFTLEIGKELSDSGKEKVENAVSVTNVEPDKITKDWNEEGLTIGFAEELAPATTYTLSVDDVTDVDGLSIKEVKDFTFKTKSVNNAFTITYNLDGGEVNLPNPISYNEASATFTLNNPTKGGYDFIGWTGTGLDIASKTLSIIQGSKSDLSFIANYAPIAYNINYVLNDGSLPQGLTNPSSYDITSATIILKNPTRDNYDFLGWEGTGIPDGTTSMDVTIPQGSTGARNYTAVFTQRFTITCNLNEGTLDDANPTSYNVTSENITLNAPSKNGYDFVGWTGSNGEVPETTVTIVQGSTGNRIYNANYSAVAYTITYDLDGGIVEGYNSTGYNIGSETITLINPSKIGYIFTGWSGTGLVGNDNMLVSIPQGSTEAKSFTAHYVLINYTITCDLVGGTVETDNQTSYDITSATIALNNPTKDDYDFLGWEGTGITDGTASMTVTIPNGSIGDRTYVASFTPRYTITYNLNGGTVATPNPTAYNIYTDDITLNNPTKTGNVDNGFYLFAGWSESEVEVATTTLVIPKGSTGDRTYTANWIILEMKKIPAGTFTMGSPAKENGGYAQERPQHQVTISKDFYIGIYEVKQSEYLAIMGNNPSNFKNKDNWASRPVEMVNHTKALAFCASLTTYLTSFIPSGYKFDLPTEAQWEYACRAGTNTALNSGLNLKATYGSCANLNVVGWYYKNATETHPVGEKTPNAWGLYDMHGNVREWVKDWHSETYYSECGDCTDPTGPATGTQIVNRGGGWHDYARFCRSAYRTSPFVPTKTNHHLGFRIVLVQE